MSTLSECLGRLSVTRGTLREHIQSFAAELATELHKDFPATGRIVELVEVLRALDEIDFVMVDVEETAEAVEAA